MCNALEQGDFMRKNFQEQLGNLDPMSLKYVGRD